MANDPLLQDEPSAEPVNELNAATIREMVTTIRTATTEEQRAEAEQAVRTVFQTSVLPCIYNVAGFADLQPEIVAQLGLQSALLSIVHANAMLTWGPPFSRNHLYEETIIDWLVQCVAADGY